MGNRTGNSARRIDYQRKVANVELGAAFGGLGAVEHNQGALNGVVLARGLFLLWRAHQKQIAAVAKVRIWCGLALYLHGSGEILDEGAAELADRPVDRVRN